MKKIYKTILALAAVMTLGAVASAQEVPYLINGDHGIAYNKYIVTDPETGSRNIRIETFATGGGERRAVPSDIVLVLDNSGSMLCYYAKSGTASKYTKTMTQDDVEQYLTTGGDPLLIPDARYYLQAYSYSYGSSVTTFGGTNSITTSSYQAFKGENDGLANAFRYAKYNGKYYRVFRHKETNHPVTGAAGPWYFLCFRLDDDDRSLMYLHDKEFVSSAPTEDLYKNSKSVIYTGDTPETVLWRAKTRMEKLEEGVNAFIDQIYENNQAIAPDLNGEVGNQIAMVAFGSGTYNLAPYESGPAISNCRIVKKFTPADSDANVSAIKGGMDRMTFLGSTALGYGLMLANEAFRLIRDGHPEMDAYEMNDDGTTYKSDAGGYPIPNRNKVVVVFTDGAPNAVSSYTSFAGVEYTDPAAVRAMSIDYSNLMKTSTAGNLNAKIFTVGLNATGAAKTLLERVSSNYLDNHFSFTVSDSGSYSYSYNPPESPSSNLFFMDAGSQDMTEVFRAIASIAGGTSDVGGSSMVNVDIVSKSFRIPKQEGESVVDKIKVYTAQCLGLDPDNPYVEDGVTKYYLAFATPKEIKSRNPVVLWTSATDEETGVVSWTKETIDVDENISVTVEDDSNGQNDVIRVSGFDYAKLWCGLDGISEHSTGASGNINTEDYVASEYGNFELGTGPYIKGYRGFKIIIDIPIALQDNAVGGPKVPTNESGSGLLDPATHTMLVPFPSPTLTIPVNLWIQKEGLQKNESATFTIQRKLAKATTANPDPQYENYTNVNVIGDVNADGTSKPVMVKLLNLDPSYYYRIVEEGWTWSYTSDAQDESTAPTTETIKTNPIIIHNDPKGAMPKHAEAVKRNNM